MILYGAKPQRSRNINTPVDSLYVRSDRNPSIPLFVFGKSSVAERDFIVNLRVPADTITN